MAAQASRLRGVDLDVIGDAGSAGRGDHDRLDAGRNSGRHLNVDLSRADVIDKRRLSANGHRSAPRAVGARSPVNRSWPKYVEGVGQILAVDLDPGRGRDGWECPRKIRP